MTDWRLISLNKDCSYAESECLRAILGILCGGLTTHSIDLFHRGYHLNESYYSKNGFVLTRAVDSIIANGGTLRVRCVHRFSPILRGIVIEMMRLVAADVWINMYLSATGSTGLGWHSDDHNIIAIQLCGAKSWELRFPNSGDLVDVQEVTHELMPVSGLIISAGVEHRVLNSSMLSLHLVIGFESSRPVLSADLLSFMAKVRFESLCFEQVSLSAIEDSFPSLSMLVEMQRFGPDFMITMHNDGKMGARSLESSSLYLSSDDVSAIDKVAQAILSLVCLGPVRYQVLKNSVPEPRLSYALSSLRVDGLISIEKIN